MSIVSRYLIKEYLCIFLFCVLSFIALLVTLRLEEIAHFAAMGAPLGVVASFAMHQIPYILPIAMPFSSLIASYLTLQRLSNHQEITVLRASGLSLWKILRPILFTSCLLSLFTLYIVSEAATQSHLATKALEREIRSINPLLLLQNKHLSSLKGIFAHTLGPSAAGDRAQDVVLAYYGKQNKQITLMASKKIALEKGKLRGTDITLIAPQKKDSGNSLFVENIKETLTPVDSFSQLIKKDHWKLNSDYLTMPQLFLYLQDYQKQLQLEQQAGTNHDLIKFYKKHINKGYVEIARRFSISLAAASFTLLGAACAIRISRNRSLKGLYQVLFLSALFIASYFAAKSLEHSLLIATSLYLLPHGLILLFSIRALRKISWGIE